MSDRGYTAGGEARWHICRETDIALEVDGVDNRQYCEDWQQMMDTPHLLSLFGPQRFVCL